MVGVARSSCIPDYAVLEQHAPSSFEAFLFLIFDTKRNISSLCQVIMLVKSIVLMGLVVVGDWR